MKLYYIVLTIVAISIAFGQPQGFNNSSIANNNGTSLISTPQLQANATNWSAESSVPGRMESPTINPAANISDVSNVSPQAKEMPNSINITCIVIERENNTRARFGVGKKEPAKLEMYNLTVRNTGENMLSNVTVIADLAKGMRFESTIYSEDNRGRLDVKRDPFDFNNSRNTTLTWNIGTLGPDEVKTIWLQLYLKPLINNTMVRANATGTMKNGTVTRDHQDMAMSLNCPLLCPEWSIPF